jgi:hypothetical protein
LSPRRVCLPRRWQSGAVVFDVSTPSRLGRSRACPSRAYGPGSMADATSPPAGLAAIDVASEVAARRPRVQLPAGDAPVFARARSLPVQPPVRT